MTHEEAFAIAIERIKRQLLTIDPEATYLDAIVVWADRNQCEIETAAAMVKKDPCLKSKLMLESQNLNMLKIKPIANTLF